MLEEQKFEFWGRVQNVGSFYEKTPTELSLIVWWESLKDQDFGVVCEAFGRHVADPDRGMWMPKPADIVALIHGKGSEAAEVAYSKAYRAVGIVGQWNDAVFDDWIIHVVIEGMGGWVNFCKGEEKDFEFKRLQFIKSYQSIRKRGDVSDYPKRLFGISNQQNAMNGFKFAQPRLIGDPKRAMAVLENGSEGSSLHVITLSGHGAQMIKDRSAGVLKLAGLFSGASN